MYPTMRKIFIAMDIIMNHAIIIFTFLLFLAIEIFMHRSLLNLISLILTLIILCTYMSKGIKNLNLWWNILTVY